MRGRRGDRCGKFVTQPCGCASNGGVMLLAEPPLGYTPGSMPSLPPSADLSPSPLYSIETYGELNPYIGYEWLLTNGLGGFASSTVVGCNTRRYHGLLCAATTPPVGRVMTL